ncbi:MAG: DEAD/DEAH box helicase [Nanoarchaeota archaeon]
MKQFEILLGKDNPVLDSIRIRGYSAPSEIQEKAIPAILEGKDVIAGASTGSGKTLAFAVGLIRNVRKDYGIQGLVLTPTRELAEQITKELTHFAGTKKLDIVSVYGGVSILHQMKRLANADIVVATPGRMLDHLARNSLNLKHVNTLVLDEADRMLDMGFIEDVEKIISFCQKKRQTLLFSATISNDIVHIAQKYMHQPIEISAEPHVDPTKLTQIYYDVDDNMKYSLLHHLLKEDASHKVIVFCNTRNNVDFLAHNLARSGIDVWAIHGGFSQDKRNKIIETFHHKKASVLIATDVAARGLDIKDISHIYNYDIPPNKKEYIHRIGRTARAGSEGRVINVVASRDHENFQQIMSGDLPIRHEPTPPVERVRIEVIHHRSVGGRFSGGGRSGGRNHSRGGGGYRGGRGSSHRHAGRDSRRFGGERRGGNFGRR